MIKELFYLLFEIIKDIFVLKWNYLGYDFKNLFWYLFYGFTYSDIQDLDVYLSSKISKTLEKYIIYSKNSYPIFEKDYPNFLLKINRIKHLSYIFSNQIEEDLNEEDKIKLREEFLNLLIKYYFYLWF